MKVVVTVSGKLYNLSDPYGVKLTSAPVDSSGGHSHTANRPTGYFGDSIRDTVKTKELETGADTLRTSYLASLFGGKERIIATMKSFVAIADTDTVVVRVPNLRELLPGQHYELVGTPLNHAGTNDPCRSTPPTSQHYRNHFGTSTLLKALASISSAYDSLHTGVRIRVNDMSLESGGLLDADTARIWRSPHKEHRKGINADIGVKAIDASNDCVDIDEEDIRSLIRLNTGLEPLRENNPPHFHVYVQEN